MNNFDEVLFLGDIHGQLPRTINRMDDVIKYKSNTAIILLGDVGANYYLDERDKEFKEKLSALTGITFYCLQGNHEQRPELIKGIERMFDCATEQYVYMEEEYPNIRYFINGEVYLFNNKTILPLGGAYSVDKPYRLKAGGNFKWFPCEQLSKEEKETIEKMISMRDMRYDIVISHTCPYIFQPFDKFIPGVDQDLVDKSTERWLQKLYDYLICDYWLCGHFHINRKIDNLYMLDNHGFLSLDFLYFKENSIF